MALPRAQEAASLTDSVRLLRDLETVARALEGMHQTLLRMPEHCDPYIYYHRVRPFIHGSQLHPVAYDGVAEYDGAPQTFHGETGAQSTIVPCLDAVLGIRHRLDELRVYLMEMRRYMSPGHVAFLSQLEARASVRDFVLTPGDAALRDAYDACVMLGGAIPLDAPGVRRALHPETGASRRELHRLWHRRHAVHALPEKRPRRDARPPPGQLTNPNMSRLSMAAPGPPGNAVPGADRAGLDLSCMQMGGAAAIARDVQAYMPYVRTGSNS